MAFDVRDRHTFSGPGTVSNVHADAIQTIVTSARPRQAMVRWMAIGRRSSADCGGYMAGERLRRFRPLFGARHTRMDAVCRRHTACVKSRRLGPAMYPHRCVRAEVKDLLPFWSPLHLYLARAHAARADRTTLKSKVTHLALAEPSPALTRMAAISVVLKKNRAASTPVHPDGARSTVLLA